ncbi:MAG: hypothetical protein ACRDFT_04075 [bacterium]
MAALREFLRKNPIVGWAIAAGLIVVIGYMLAGALGLGGRPAQRPGTGSPAPAPAVTPAPLPAPLAVTPGPSVPTGPTGRLDPFVPLVRAAATPSAPSPSGPPASPGTPPPPLPPPPLPVPSIPLPPPPLPGGPGATPAPAPAPSPPPNPAAGIAVLGIVADTKAVAIIRVGGRTEIVGEGELIGDLRVVRIDPVRRIVTFSRAGTRFDVPMGGG